MKRTMIVLSTSIVLATVITTLSFGANGYEQAQRTFLDEQYPDSAAIQILRTDQEQAVRFFLAQLDIHNRDRLSVGEPISTKLSALVCGNPAFRIPPMKWNKKAVEQLKAGLLKNLKDGSLSLQAASCSYLQYLEPDLTDSTEDLIAETAQRAIESKDVDLRMVGYVIAGTTGPRLVPYLLKLLRNADTLSAEDRQLLYFSLKDIGPPAIDALKLLRTRKANEKHPALIDGINGAIATISGEVPEESQKTKSRENQDATPP